MYDPVTDSFHEYESVKPNKVILPTMENIGYLPDITGIGIPTKDGNIIMNPARSLSEGTQVGMQINQIDPVKTSPGMNVPNTLYPIEENVQVNQISPTDIFSPGMNVPSTLPSIEEDIQTRQINPANPSLISPEEIFTPQENVSVDVVIPKQEEERPATPYIPPKNTPITPKNPTPPKNTSNGKGQKSSRVNNTPIVPKNDWVRQLAQAYRNLGVSENGIRNLIAKNALESNWGKSAQGRYNYGNITTGKSWKGNYVNGHDRDSKGRPIRNKFRSYNSIEEFAKDEVEFLKRLYDFDDNDDIDTFINKLLGGNKGKRRYAEDPKYSSKLKQIYKNL